MVVHSCCIARAGSQCDCLHHGVPLRLVMPGQIPTYSNSLLAQPCEHGQDVGTAPNVTFFRFGEDKQSIASRAPKLAPSSLGVSFQVSQADVSDVSALCSVHWWRIVRFVLTSARCLQIPQLRAICGNLWQSESFPNIQRLRSPLPKIGCSPGTKKSSTIQSCHKSYQFFVP